jgi:hypothetical protein
VLVAAVHPGDVAAARWQQNGRTRQYEWQT